MGLIDDDALYNDKEKLKLKQKLDDSKKFRKEAFAHYGNGLTSILTLDRAYMRETDLSTKNGKRYSDTYRTDLPEEFKNSTLKYQGLGTAKGALSRFPKNIGRTIIRLYCPDGGVIYDPFCVGGDTLISTPEGDIPIRQLIGTEPYVYCSNGREIKLRKAKNIRKTQTGAEVLKLVLDNGSFFYITPNHLVMLSSGKWIKACDLKQNQSLMPFYRVRHKQSGRWMIRVCAYKMVRQSRFVYEEITGTIVDTKKFDVHHKDGDFTNDAPTNLEIINHSDHSKIHHPNGVPYEPTEASRRNLSKALTGSGNPFYGRNHTDVSKELIGSKSKGRNVGRLSSDEQKTKAQLHRTDRSWVPKVQELLMENTYTYAEIADIVGVHPNTVSCVAKNKFNYNHKVVSIERMSIGIDVYNMEVEEFNNFVANGVVVHNCGHDSRMSLVHVLGYDYIGVDICEEFMNDNRETREKLLKKDKRGLIKGSGEITLYCRSSENVPDVASGSCDFTITSPPYWDIEYYGPEAGQLGTGKTYDQFLDGLCRVLEENYRVLKKGSFCAYFVNDFRKDGVFYPYHMDTYGMMQDVGFEPFNIYIVDLGPHPIGSIFLQQVISTKVLPKRHEYCLVFKKV